MRSASSVVVGLAMAAIACAPPRPSAPPPVAPPIVVTPPPADTTPPRPEPEPQVPLDRLVPVRYVSDDPELALVASRIAARAPALEACADAELASSSAAGFVRVTVDQAVPRSASGELPIVPTVAGIGSATLHACVRDALGIVTLPASLGRARRVRLAFTVDLRIGTFDPELQALPDHGDTLVVDDEGGCEWLHENPCAPHKSCMGPQRRATRCPIAWGPRPPDNSSDVPHAMLFYTQPCADVPDTRCTLLFDRDGDACVARLRDERTDGARIDSAAMACADFERLWASTSAKGMPKAFTDGRAATADRSIGANHIRPRWSAYRTKRWQWSSTESPAAALLDLQQAMLAHATSLGLPVAQRCA